MPNTGRKRYTETDVNPNSPTFGQTRFGAWISDPTACPPATRYTSAEVSGYVSKNDCPSGQSTQPILYVVTAGSFFSFTSQADADTQAQDFFEQNKQQYANQNGVCGSRTVSVTSAAKQAKRVVFQLTRSVSTGSVDVEVQADVFLDNGSGSQSDSKSITVTIPDGQTQITGTIDFAPAVLQSLTACVINSTDPATYTF